MHPKLSVPLTLSLLLLFSSAFCSGQTQPGCPEKGKITAVRLVTLSETDGGKVNFRLAIEGEQLPATKADVKEVLLDTKDPSKPVTVTDIVSSDPKQVLVMASAQSKTEVTCFHIVAIDPAKNAETKAFTIAIAENPPQSDIHQFSIKMEHDNKGFPNVHTLWLTTDNTKDGGFDPNPHRMTVDLMPGGASDTKILEAGKLRLKVQFFAAADYVPTSAVVTVYDGSDLDSRKATAIGTAKKAPQDPNQPKVDHTEIVFVNRSHGVGRIRIFGEGFGDYAPPPYQVDDYLWNCLEEFHIRATDRYLLSTEREEFDEFAKRIEACRQMLSGKYVDGIEDKISAGECALGEKPKDPTKMCPEGSQLKTKNNEIEHDDEPELKKQFELTKTSPGSFVANNDWTTWAEKVRKAVNVSLRSRNPDIQVERAEIININDKIIDVYFEFTRYRGFSFPLRLESSEITIKKTVQKTTQTVKDDKFTATVSGPKQETYAVKYDIEPKRDPNLIYKYTILNNDEANRRLGRGIAENFYVVQLSVVSTAKKKVTIPLASIQAEIEWIRGRGETSNTLKRMLGRKKTIVSFIDGPPTLAPIPLAAVSSDFEAYQKAKGLRAKLFNAMDAATTVATALVPFTGPAVKDGEVFFSGGFIPGVKKAVGDLSSQQLQNLTSQSWENSETIPAGGGSIEKLIYIQKGSQQFNGDKETKAVGVPGSQVSQVASIMGIEVTGYEVTDNQAKTATQASKDSAKPATSKESDQQPDAGQAPAQEESTPPTE
jgi:hypothetical protein